MITHEIKNAPKEVVESHTLPSASLLTPGGVGVNVRLTEE